MKLEFVSDRLSFRPLDERDTDLAIEQWTDPVVCEYVADRSYSADEIRGEMPVITRRAGGGCIGIWCLSDKETGEKLGTALLLPMPVELEDNDWDLVNGGPIPEGDIEIGYILKKSAWGKGYATEACMRLLRFAFKESPLQEVVACIDPRNEASRRVLTKARLREIGLIRAYKSDLPGFRITRTEWQEETASCHP